MVMQAKWDVLGGGSASNITVSNSLALVNDRVTFCDRLLQAETRLLLL